MWTPTCSKALVQIWNFYKIQRDKNDSATKFTGATVENFDVRAVKQSRLLKGTVTCFA